MFNLMGKKINLFNFYAKKNFLIWTNNIQDLQNKIKELNGEEENELVRPLVNSA